MLLIPFLALGIFFLMIMIAGLVVGILFLASLQRTLDRCSRRNRAMDPALVWLCLIPVFGIAWIFRVVFAVGDSLRNEYVDRDIGFGGDFGKTIGLCWLSTNLIGVMLFYGSRFIAFKIGLLGSLPFLIASLVLFVVYWVQIVGYRRQLERDNDREDDREYDDERRRLPAKSDDRFR